MNTRGHYHCDECGPIPAMKHPPTHCPICGREIYFRFDTEAKRFATSDERAAEWFKKMHDATNNTNDKKIPDSD